MKKVNYALLAALVGAGIYIVTDAYRAAKDKLLRIAAGESDYERTHRRK